MARSQGRPSLRRWRNRGRGSKTRLRRNKTMCNPISWIESEGNIYIITDAEVKSEKGKELIKEAGNPSDIWGHGFCRAYYGVKGGRENEINDFSKVNLFPAEIKKLLSDFNRNFGHMMGLHVPDLRALTSAEGLVLPKEVNGYLDLSALTSAEGLVLPEKCGYLDLSALTSAEGLVLPEKCGSLDLRALTSAEGLVLPKEVNGYLDLRALTSADGLVLPEKCGSLH